jgi:hypothetical protein
MRSFWDEIKAGRLNESAAEAIARALTGGHGRGAEVYALYRTGPQRSRPLPQAKRDVRSEPGGPVFAKFDYVRRHHIEKPLPPVVTSGKGVALYAIRPEVADLRDANAKRHGKVGIYIIDKDFMTSELEKFTGPEAKERRARVLNRRAAKPSAAARFQRYIDGPANGKSGGAEGRVETIDGKPSLLGNIGTDRAERARFWPPTVAKFKRANARFQYRITITLPAYFTPQERWLAVEEIGRALFDPYGINWSAAIHKPTPKSRGVDRNFHVHILFAPLDPERMRAFQESDDRIYLKLGWPSVIKRAAAKAFNDVYWRRERRIGLERGTPIFFVEEARGGGGGPRENARKWRAEEKYQRAGLPTAVERKAVLEGNHQPPWMSLEPILPVLQGISDLLPALVPSRLSRDPVVEKALVRLRDWAERLIENVLESIRQTFEVATYLSLPLSADRSELLERVFEQLRHVDWHKVPGRFDYWTGYSNLEYEKWRSKKFEGRIERELGETIRTIEAIESTHFLTVKEMRLQLAAYHRLMTQTLQTYQQAMEALKGTIGSFDSLSPEKAAQTFGWRPYAFLAIDGTGVAILSGDTGRTVYIEEFGRLRKATLDEDMNLTFPKYRDGYDDPWLGRVRELEAKRIQGLWQSAVARSRHMAQSIGRSQREEELRRQASETQPAASLVRHSQSATLQRTSGGVAHAGRTSSQASGARAASQSQSVASKPQPAAQSPTDSVKPDTAAPPETGLSVADAIAAFRSKPERGQQTR